MRVNETDGHHAAGRFRWEADFRIRLVQGPQLQLLKTAKEEWENTVIQWYPLLYEQTYFLPPVFMMRIQRCQETVGKQTVLVNKPPEKRARTSAYLESDLREDMAHLKVLKRLEQLSQNEVMFVISKLELRDYLSEPRYALAASQLPRPVDPGLSHQPDGDIDILIIHRKHGIVAAEIKAVGDNAEDRQESSEQLDANLLKRVEQATRQLHKHCEMLTHVVSKDEAIPTIRTTLVLPHIGSTLLQRVLKNNRLLREDLCRSLGVDASVDPTGLCLTEKDLTDPDRWWTSLTRASADDPAMNDSVYLDLVSRFGGPATSVCVPSVKVFFSNKQTKKQNVRVCLRTLADCVAEVAKRVAPKEIVLNRRQVETLEMNTHEKLVYLTGPPGTGKTLVLIMKGLDWLSEGKSVQVVSSSREGQPAAFMIFTELKESAGPGTERRIGLHHLDLGLEADSTEKAAAVALAKQNEDGKLYIIADEASRYIRKLLDLLHEHQVQDLNIWAASMFVEHIPQAFKKEELTEALRTTPRTAREVQISGFMNQGEVLRYTTKSNVPPPCEGPKIISILHDRENGHSGNLTYDCPDCGKQVVSVLHDLNLGRTRSSLHYRETFVLTAGHYLHEGSRDNSSTVTQASGFLRGLGEGGIPFRVLKEDASQKAIREVAIMTGPDQVVVGDCSMVRGLERPVVVWVQGDITSMDEDQGRLDAISRCTAQLIWVRPGSSPVTNILKGLSLKKL